MKAGIKAYKRRLDRDLRHIKLILSQARHHMPVKEWLELVQQTKNSVLTHPEEFFCCPPSDPALLGPALDKVFDGFLEDQRLLALQTSRGFKY